MVNLKKLFSSYYKFFQALSLDVVIGVLAVSLFASNLLEVEAKPEWIIILAFATWSFYTIDHLIDGIKSKGKSTIFRHQFHFNNKTLLATLVIIFGVTSLLLSLLFLNFQIIQVGLLMGLLVLVYFTVLKLFGNKKSFFLQKEIIIAFVYVAGIWLAPLVWLHEIPETFTIIVISVLFFLAWAEGVMASWFDYENDLTEGHSSFTVLFGKQNTRIFLIVLHILIFIIIKLSVFFVSSNLQFAAMIILALMNLSLLLIILYPSTFSKNERYRIVGEMVFWLPFLILLADLF